MGLWLLLYRCQRQDLTDKLWEMFFHHCSSLADTTTNHQASQSPPLQVAAIPPEAGGLHHPLTYLLPQPTLFLSIPVSPPWSMCPSYLPLQVGDSSRSTHLFFTLQVKFTTTFLYPTKPLTFLHTDQLSNLSW